MGQYIYIYIYQTAHKDFGNLLKNISFKNVIKLAKSVKQNTPRMYKFRMYKVWFGTCTKKLLNVVSCCYLDAAVYTDSFTVRKCLKEIRLEPNSNVEYGDNILDLLKKFTEDISWRDPWSKISFFVQWHLWWSFLVI